MVKKAIVNVTITIPEGVEAKVDGRKVLIKGPLGRIEHDFSHAPISIKHEEGQLKVEASWPDKKINAMVGTISSHIKNMITGVVKGFRYKLKIVFAHFPMSIKIQNKEVLIENFYGERRPRKAEIKGDVKVNVEGDDIIVQGIDIMDVSQTAANIQEATRIKKRDPRVFLDGIYIFERREESL